MAVVSECTGADTSNLSSESGVCVLAIIVYPPEIWLKLRVIVVASVREQFGSPLKQFSVVGNTQKNSLVCKKSKIGKGGAAGDGDLAQFLGKPGAGQQ